MQFDHITCQTMLVIAIMHCEWYLWNITDWEALADREPDALLSTVPSDCLSGVSNLKLENTKSQTPKRRGRGTFSYEKQELYSDQLLDGIDVEDEETHCSSEDKRDIPKCKWHLDTYQYYPVENKQVKN